MEKWVFCKEKWPFFLFFSSCGCYGHWREFITLAEANKKGKKVPITGNDRNQLPRKNGGPKKVISKKKDRSDQSFLVGMSQGSSESNHSDTFYRNGSTISLLHFIIIRARGQQQPLLNVFPNSFFLLTLRSEIH